MKEGSPGQLSPADSQKKWGDVTVRRGPPRLSRGKVKMDFPGQLTRLRTTQEDDKGADIKPAIEPLRRFKISAGHKEWKNGRKLRSPSNC